MGIRQSADEGRSTPERAPDPVRHDHVRRGRILERFTIVYNGIEGVVTIIAGWFAGSASLTGFGLDSLIEVTSGAALLWRLKQGADPERTERAERVSLNIVGGCFLALALYVLCRCSVALLMKSRPEQSLPGIIMAGASVIVMPLLARSKRRIAAALDSDALAADSRQADFCAYLSAILLVGLSLNALLGWWWADPAAGLLMAPIIAKEGIDGLRGKKCCSHCSGSSRPDVPVAGNRVVPHGTENSGE